MFYKRRPFFFIKEGLFYKTGCPIRYIYYIYYISLEINDLAIIQALTLHYNR